MNEVKETDMKGILSNLLVVSDSLETGYLQTRDGR